MLVNIDKGGDFIREILPIIQRTGTEKQVIIKGKYALDRVKADYGDSKGMLYMPIVDMFDSAAVARGLEFAKKMRPVAFELNFRTEQQLDPDFVKLVCKQGSRVWINTLWDNPLRRSRRRERAHRGTGQALGMGARPPRFHDTDRPA